MRMHTAHLGSRELVIWEIRCKQARYAGSGSGGRPRVGARGLTVEGQHPEIHRSRSQVRALVKCVGAGVVRGIESGSARWARR